MAHAAEPVILRAVMFQDSGKWVAQCLEHDIGVQADNVDDLYGRLEVVLRLQSKESVAVGHAPLADVPAAPATYFDMWDRRPKGVTPMTISLDGDGNGGGMRSRVELALCA